MDQLILPDPGRPDYCARCATPLVLEMRGGRPRPICPACGWVYYAKPALGAAVAIEQEGQLVLVQRRFEPYAGWWMLPAGFVEYGEFAEDTAGREAEEETGLQVTLDGLLGLYFGAGDPRNVAHWRYTKRTPRAARCARPMTRWTCAPSRPTPFPWRSPSNPSARPSPTG
jgi:8-oxo-dGTP pyrophosphatase MutT (NUDIX family)